jgi:hypothetical protein
MTVRKYFPNYQIKIPLAVGLVYFAFRVLGATKRHAWNAARLVVTNAVMDKAIEKTGVRDPRVKPKPGNVQITFEGGPADQEVRHVEDCATIELTHDDGLAVYRRTQRVRGHSIVFEVAA